MLFESLKNNKRIPFHMPGHKRNINLLGDDFPLDIDITEISGFDDLHRPESCIREIEQKAARIYRSDNSFILVNGSTVGILAGVHSVVEENEPVLISRNCHQSVYNALQLVKAKVEYLTPQSDDYGIFGKISLYDLECKINKFNPKLIVVTSPTYEGVESDLQGICNIAHSKNVPVLVDAAHGAHSVEKFRSCNADIIVMSLHKTLPALTQCAVAHINGSLVDAEKFRIMLSVFETSSPSYLLMSSIEKCLDFTEKNKELFNEYYLRLNNLRQGLQTLKHLKLLDYDDIGKIVIFTGFCDITAVELSDILRNKYNIEVEMATESYIIAMTSLCDDFNNYLIFEKALRQIDLSLKHEKYEQPKLPPLPCKAAELWQINNCEYIDFKDAAGRISGEYVRLYPPGVPIAAPGEIISGQLIRYIERSFKNNVRIRSTYGRLPQRICVQKV